jgi:hypothetical protein
MVAGIRQWCIERRRAGQMQRIRDRLAWFGYQVYDVEDAALMAAADELARLHPDPSTGPREEALTEIVAALARRHGPR